MERTTFHRFAHHVTAAGGTAQETLQYRSGNWSKKGAAEGGPGGGDALAEAVAAG
jgi:hypothetical protein